MFSNILNEIKTKILAEKDLDVGHISVEGEQLIRQIRNLLQAQEQYLLMKIIESGNTEALKINFVVLRKQIRQQNGN